MQQMQQLVRSCDVEDAVKLAPLIQAQQASPLLQIDRKPHGRRNALGRRMAEDGCRARDPTALGHNTLA